MIDNTKPMERRRGFSRAEAGNPYPDLQSLWRLLKEDIEGNMVKRKGTKRRHLREDRALNRVSDHAKASHAAGLPLAITLPIPTCWTAEQAIAVFELIDDLRERIWSFYQADLQELTRQQRQLEPVDPVEINEDDPSF